MRRVVGTAVLVAAAAVIGGCETQHGFLKVGASTLLDDTDRLACGEAEIAPKAGGLLDAFVTLKPQDCDLTLHRSGDVLWFGTKLCTLHIANNRITSVYLTEGRAGLACSVGGA